MIATTTSNSMSVKATNARKYRRNDSIAKLLQQDSLNYPHEPPAVDLLSPGRPLENASNTPSNTYGMHEAAPCQALIAADSAA